MDRRTMVMGGLATLVGGVAALAVGTDEVDAATVADINYVTVQQFNRFAPYMRYSYPSLWTYGRNGFTYYRVHLGDFYGNVSYISPTTLAAAYDVGATMVRVDTQIGKTRR